MTKAEKENYAKLARFGCILCKQHGIRTDDSPTEITTYADLAILEPTHRAFHFVPTITGLAIPQFIHLEKRHLHAIGASLRKIC